MNSMVTFSQRLGLKPIRSIAQVGAMDAELRNSIWNALADVFWSQDDFLYDPALGRCGAMEEFSRRIWADLFKLPADSRPGERRVDRGHQILAALRERFFSCEWHEVYDLLQFVVSSYGKQRPQMAAYFNKMLARELAGYKFIDDVLVNITDKLESEALEHALADTKFPAVTAHLKQALHLFADREHPDYRNSIKESISAVEAMARVVAGTPKATLADALKALERKSKLHPALKDGFAKFYGYTNDDDGIRHAMLDEPDLDQADARYFLVSCTTFVNYLKANLA